MIKIMKRLLICSSLLFLVACMEKEVSVFDDVEMNEYAEEIALNVKDGNIDYAYDLFLDKYKQGVTLENYRTYVESVLTPAGQFDSIISVEFNESKNPLSEEPIGASTIRMRYEKGIVIYIIAFDKDKNITGLSLRLDFS
jgi:hypothetical protein